MSNRRLAWTYICQFGKNEFTGKQLMQAIEINNAQVRYFIKLLLDHQRIEIKDRCDSMLNHRYRLIDDTPLPVQSKKKKARPRVLQRLWNTCRIMKVFTFHDLRSTAMAGKSTSQRFIRALVKARIVRDVGNSDGELFRLNVDLGPKCPIVTPDGIRCPNKDRFFPFKEAL
ncbi:hypothetical protein [Photobacterium sanguinicancri]|uniref:hypothetical protein n=1 Tax=Photobacterium sanguinicancri TaxID=875932 RepID=UPI0026E418C0|nr:hypothetical protein [Photobacterium sanguinicancri]MDO6497357.1 hypothetical protein [Photobacterium sanguinicancri]